MDIERPFFRLLDHPRFWRGTFLASVGFVCALLWNNPNYAATIVGFAVTHGAADMLVLLIACSLTAVLGYSFRDTSCAAELRAVNLSIKQSHQALVEFIEQFERAERRNAALRRALQEALVEIPELSRDVARDINRRLNEAVGEADATFVARAASRVLGGLNERP